MSALQVAVLARAAVPGAAKTRLIPRLGAERAAALQAHLTELALQRARASGADVVLWFDGVTDESHAGTCAIHGMPNVRVQPEGDLGTRMLAALVHAQQCDRIGIVIGTDCPAQQSDDLLKAGMLLASHEVVLQPALDGGYVLIGMREPHARTLLRGYRLGHGQSARQRHAQRMRALGLPIRRAARAARSRSARRHGPCAAKWLDRARDLVMKSGSRRVQFRRQRARATLPGASPIGRSDAAFVVARRACAAPVAGDHPAEDSAAHAIRGRHDRRPARREGRGRRLLRQRRAPAECRCDGDSASCNGAGASIASRRRSDLSLKAGDDLAAKVCVLFDLPLIAARLLRSAEDRTRAATVQARPAGRHRVLCLGPHAGAWDLAAQHLYRPRAHAGAALCGSRRAGAAGSTSDATCAPTSSARSVPRRAAVLPPVRRSRSPPTPTTRATAPSPISATSHW